MSQHNVQQDPLRAQLDEPEPTFWQPEPDDVVTGVLQRYQRGESKYGPYWIAVVHADPNGQPVAIRIQHAVLREHFARHRPKPGERIGIKRKTDRTGANGTYKDFALAVERAASEEAVPQDFGEPADDDGHTF